MPACRGPDCGSCAVRPGPRRIAVHESLPGREGMSSETEDNERLDLRDIHTGVPLPFDVYDSNGRLLLNHGYVIGSDEQLHRLLERGAYVKPAELAAAREQQESEAQPAKPMRQDVCVFEVTANAQARLATLLSGRMDAGSFVAGVHEVAGTVQDCCVVDADAALAVLQLARTQRYSVRHAFNVALVVEMVARQLGRTPEQRQSMVAAALTMNLGMRDLQD